MINYIGIGDATQPVGGHENKIIVHICNDVGAWGAGFVLALSKRWKEPEHNYRSWYQSKKNFELGKVRFVQVEDDIWVANMIGQHLLYPDQNGIPPIRYDAVEECLKKVCVFAIGLKAIVHMPRIGCGLAGGTWDKIEPLIINELDTKGVDTVVYDF